MKNNQILHVMIMEKFLPQYIDFVDENFGRDNQYYVFITSEKYQYGLTPEHNVEFLHTNEDIFVTLLRYMNISRKVILHGLWRDKVDQLLVKNQEVLQKCYWIMWGGDFFHKDLVTENRKKVIQKVGYLVTGTVGDYELAQKWYGAIGKHVFGVINYPSNLYRDIIPIKKPKNMIYILIGNSATSSNRHFLIFQILKKYKDKNIKIFTPLSYGDQKYKREVIKQGKFFFGKKFIPMVKFMDLDEYNNFLSQIDIALFNHIRQQGAGNAYTLLSTGAKIYMNPVSNLYQTLIKDNIKIYDIKKVNLTSYKNNIREENRRIAKINFSEDALAKTIQLYLS